MRIHRRFAMLVAALAAALTVGSVPAAADPAGGAVNFVLVQTNIPGQTSVRASTQITAIGAPTVAPVNAATAINSDCAGCHTSAVAVQFVIVQSNPSVFAQKNAAVAVNGGCDGCGAYAYAFQDIIQTDGPEHLSADAEQRVAQLRQQIADAAASILPSDGLTDPCPVFPIDPTCPSRDAQLDAKLNDLTGELDSLIRADLHAGGPSAPNVQVQEAPGQ